jgi:hypothetical protein
LKEKGVLTYADLARLDKADLRTLIRARPSWSGVDVSTWITEARARAGILEAPATPDHAQVGEESTAASMPAAPPAQLDGTSQE